VAFVTIVVCITINRGQLTAGWPKNLAFSCLRNVVTKRRKRTRKGKKEGNAGKNKIKGM
jgi:hypothetical protein